MHSLCCPVPLHWMSLTGCQSNTEYCARAMSFHFFSSSYSSFCFSRTHVSLAFVIRIAQSDLPDFESTSFSSRPISVQLHFPVGRFWEEKLGSWLMKCAGTEKLIGQRKRVTLEHISGDKQTLTLKYQLEKFSLPVSSLPRETRDVSIHVTIEINHPTDKTLADLLPSARYKMHPSVPTLKDIGSTAKRARNYWPKPT